MIRFGGSFAPPLSDESLAKYKAIIDGLDSSPVKDAMAVLLNCCNQWWAQPESAGEGKLHSSGVGTVIMLDDPIAVALEPHIPWRNELDMMRTLFETIRPDNQKELRDAAFHLLWHGYELEMGREPLTNDKL